MHCFPLSRKDIDFAASPNWIILAKKTVIVKYHVTQSSLQGA